MPPPLLLLLLLPLLVAAGADAYPSPCSNATCGDVTIAYPFWLNSSSPPPSCGYPGLGLSCENNATLILLGKTHRYRVSRIAYDTHTISLVDADALDDRAATCPLLNFNLTIDAGSALQLTLSDSNITVFYNCTKSASSWSPSGAVELTGCPGYKYNRSSYVFTGDGGALAGGAYEFGCEAAVVAPVLDAHKKAMVGSPSPPAIGFGDVLMGGFELNYSPNSDQCGRCERSRGWCGYRQNQTHGGMGFTCFCDEGPTTDQCGAAGCCRRSYWRVIDSSRVAPSLLLTRTHVRSPARRRDWSSR